MTDLREGTVVPNVTVVGETVANETQTTLFNVLFYGVERLVLGDLELGVGPAGDLYDHVEDTIALVGEERDVVEGRDDGSVLFRVDAMFWRESVSRLATDGREMDRDLPKVLGAPMTRVENSGEGDEVVRIG